MLTTITLHDWFTFEFVQLFMLLVIIRNYFAKNICARVSRTKDQDTVGGSARLFLIFTTCLLRHIGYVLILSLHDIKRYFLIEKF